MIDTIDLGGGGGGTPAAPETMDVSGSDVTDDVGVWVRETYHKDPNFVGDIKYNASKIDGDLSFWPAYKVHTITAFGWVAEIWASVNLDNAHGVFDPDLGVLKFVTRLTIAGSHSLETEVDEKTLNKALYSLPDRSASSAGFLVWTGAESYPLTASQIAHLAEINWSMSNTVPS